jgi:hypothetical protein
MSTHTNRRRHQRVPVRCPVRFSQDHGFHAEGTLHNLSEGGCAIECAQDLPLTNAMLVSLRLALPDGEAPMHIETGEVRWAVQRKFGVEFQIISLHDHKRLDHFLQNARATQPQPVG